MPTTVQARLDRKSERELQQLVRRLGWSPSRVVREGIRLLAGCQTRVPPKRIAGLGQFSSKISNLGSSKSHLKGFGR